MTLDLLRDILAHDAEAAAAPERIAAVRARLPLAAPMLSVSPAPAGRQAQPRHRRLRIGLAAVAAGAIAASVIALFVVVQRPATPLAATTPSATATPSPTRPPGLDPADPLPVTAFAYTVDPDPGGLIFSDETTSSGGVQTGTWVRASDGLPQDTLTLALARSGEVPVRPAGASDVEVGGVVGWTVTPTDGYGTLLACRYGNYDCTFGRLGAVTVWSAGTGVWVVLRTVNSDAARIAEMATTVNVGVYRDVRSPIGFGWLPPDAELDRVLLSQSGSSSAGVTDADQVTFVFGPHGSELFWLTVAPEGSNMTSPDPRSSATPRPITVGRFHGDWRADDPITTVSDGQVEVTVMAGQAHQPATREQPDLPGTALPLDEITRLVQGLEVADLADPGTWFDLPNVLPA